MDWFSLGLRQPGLLVDDRNAERLVFAVWPGDFDEGVDFSDGRDVRRDEGFELGVELVDFGDVAGEARLLGDVLEEVLDFC